MALEPVVIPEKIYFKIGEVCDLVGVQAHVLRYWETEFPMLSPQKNKSGQRSYRRRDVEIAVRIKQLLYNEMFTIAGARKKLQSENRDGSRSKAVAAAVPEPVVAPQPSQLSGTVEAPTLFEVGFTKPLPPATDGIKPAAPVADRGQQEAIKILAGHLLELREMLKSSPVN